MKEIWKNVVGYEGLYQVSNQGRVKGIKKMTRWRSLSYIKRILKERKDCKGYIRAVLYKNNTRKEFPIHRLVLNAFIGESKLQCNHKNGIKDDNRLKNLEWISASENMKHSYLIGKHNPIRGELNGMNLISEDKVKRIKFIRKHIKVERGYWAKLSRALKVHPSTIKNIINERSWKHVEALI